MEYLNIFARDFVRNWEIITSSNEKANTKVDGHYVFDERINEMNWYVYCICFMTLLQFTHQWCLNFAPRPQKFKNIDVTVCSKKERLAYLDFYSQFPSLVHCLTPDIFVPIAIYYAGHRYEEENHLYFIMLSHCALSYFMWHCVVELYYGTWDKLYMLHHGIGITGSLLLCHTRAGCYEWTHVYFLSEITNPLCILRILMDHLDMQDNIVYKINQTVFAIAFLTIRMFVTPFYIMWFYRSATTYYYTKLMFSFMAILQQNWCMRIIKLAMKPYVEGIKKKDQKLGPITGALWNFLENLKNSESFNNKFQMFVAFCYLVVPTLYYDILGLHLK